MTREEKIQAIYEKIANKELTFWCRVNTEYWRIVSVVEEAADERWYIVVSEESLYNDEDIGAYYCWLRVRWLEDMESIGEEKWILFYFSGTTRGFRLMSNQMSVLITFTL